MQPGTANAPYCCTCVQCVQVALQQQLEQVNEAAVANEVQHNMETEALVPSLPVADGAYCIWG